MPKIELLNDDVVAAISAGEVVERPLSVVKELVDNAIDAKADRIEITIEIGGKSYIEIKDNGEGMSAEDLQLCLLKHATSKISKKEDLFNIKTMGFRGEALYSISQVSELSITSKRPAELIGYRLIAVGGKIISFSEFGCPVGTTVAVSNLFFNLPVRKKFLKSDNWEKSLIIEFIQQISLVYPNISFILHADKKDLIVLNRCKNKTERIIQLFPKLSNSLSQNTFSNDNYVGEAFISIPDLDMQNFYLFSVNGRPVKDKVFYKVVNDVFSGQRKKPSFLHIDIKLPENQVDVNVHPTKKEVRFRDNNLIYNFLRVLLEDGSKKEADKIYKNTERPIAPPGKLTFSNSTPLFENQVAETKSDYIRADNNFKLIGTFANGFLIIEKGHNLLIIDQHAAHERLIFNKLMTDLKNNSITPQMIIPHVFTPKHSTIQLLDEIQEPLSNLGFSFEQVAPDTFAITAIPPFISYDTGINTFFELIESKECFGYYEDFIYSTVATMACKEAVKKTDLLTLDEIQSLLNEVFSNNKHYCPHGRNYIIEITLEELEKRLGRKD